MHWSPSSINFPGYDLPDVVRAQKPVRNCAAGADPELIPSSSGVPTVRGGHRPDAAPSGSALFPLRRAAGGRLGQSGTPNRSRPKSVTGGFTDVARGRQVRRDHTSGRSACVRGSPRSTCESCSKAKRNTAATSRNGRPPPGGLRRHRCRGHLRHGNVKSASRPSPRNCAESSRASSVTTMEGPPQRDVRGSGPDALMVLINC